MQKFKSVKIKEKLIKLSNLWHQRKLAKANIKGGLQTHK
jgi:hypothetical protein